MTNTKKIITLNLIGITLVGIVSTIAFSTPTNDYKNSGFSKGSVTTTVTTTEVVCGKQMKTSLYTAGTTKSDSKGYSVVLKDTNGNKFFCQTDTKNNIESFIRLP